MGLKHMIGRLFRTGKTFVPSNQAYNKWSSSYDEQPGNLMLDLDEQIFAELFKEINIGGRQVVDVGCGTGRHWTKLLSSQPSRLIGFDSSSGMLKRLKEKFPDAEVYVSDNHEMVAMPDSGTDLIVCTLTIAHIEYPGEYFREWVRILKPGGYILLTDYHPEALQRGAKRTFQYQKQTIAIRNFVHSISDIRNIAGQLGLVEQRFLERVIDESVRSYYEAQGAIELYRSFQSVPIIYGILLKKPHAAM